MRAKHLLKYDGCSESEDHPSVNDLVAWDMKPSFIQITS